MTAQLILTLAISDPAAARQEARAWLKETKATLPGLPPAEALAVVNVYDLIHRIAYGTPADTAIIDRHTLRALDARIRGDRSIDPYLLYRQIGTGIRRHNPAYSGRPMQWYSLMLDRWYSEIKNGSRQPLSTADRRQRIQLLLESDLYPYETHNEPAFKSSLRTQLL